MNVIETTNLSKNYGSKTVVDNVNLTIREGDIYGLIGRNGAGKTTLIRMILGLAKSTNGSVSINGANSKDALNYERAKIGSLIDYPSYEPNMSAIDNLKAVALSLGIKKKDEELQELLHFVGLNTDKKFPAKKFSLGMKQRLAIAIALIGDPQVLILDEPVNGLDPTGIFEVREILMRLNREKKVTILISSHLLTELSKLATCYGVMDNGKLIKELRGGDLDELCRPFIKVVVGDLQNALRVVTENYNSSEFEILPFNTLAIYNLDKGVGGVASLFAENNIPVVSIAQNEGDLETTFITMMGGIQNEK